MQEERIRLTSTDSTNSVNKNSFVDVELQHHTKVFPFPSISNTIDQRELFEKERAESTKYRLILTINPYCTNVLFNTVTEIVQNEGTDVPGDLKIASSEGIINANNGAVVAASIDGYTIRGKVGNQSQNPLTSDDMVRNTEYTNGDEPFVYHCGINIFNNHILRNQSFKVVNPLTQKSNKYGNTSNATQIKNNFNTIFDMMRYADGSEIKLTRRTDVKTIEGVSESRIQNNARHLYLKDDIMTFIDSMNANISEQNGWWGFNNRSSIAASEFKSNTNTWEDLNISKVMNGKYTNKGEETEHVACEFIEMYPDSKLYSFNSNYNRLQNREEQNWDVCITYPYENDDDSNLLLINGSLKMENMNDEVQIVNALLLASYKQTKGTSGQDILLFRSYVKHNLGVGSKIKLYYNLNNSNRQGNFVEIKDRQFNVINVGNLKGDYLEYYFYINDVNEIKKILGIDENEDINEHQYTFRFVKVVNDRDCKYYYRKFRKLPNLRFKKEELTDEIVNNRETLNGNPNPNYNSEIQSFEEYIDNNCRKTANSEMRPFNKEQYPLAFSRTIYDDDNTQIVFTDTIDIDKFTDNLGRPLTELFVTIIKRNKGHDLWYKKKKTKKDLQNIEFSHCFGEVVSGLDVHTEWSDDESLKDWRRDLGDCTLLTNNNEEFALDNDIVLEHNNDPNDDKDIFYGDVVELDKNNMKETVLSDVHFRFNTEQREHIFQQGEIDCSKYEIDEIETDDYDYAGWVCNTTVVSDSTYRPEGYHYKAHYPVKVREFGSMRQGSHKDIKVSSCRPRQANGMFIEVVSSLRSGVASGDIVFLCDENEEIMIPLVVNSVQSSVRFLLNPMVYGSDNYMNVFEIVEGLLHSDEKTITQEDINNHYVWIDKDGNRNMASGEIRNTSNVVIYQSDLGKTIYDYGSPKYTLKLKNNSIPSYALKVGVNTYLWRDVLNVGHKDTVELAEYPFANGHFYINKEINFFLERQDPFNYGGLYAALQTPNDIFGNIKKESNYVYKDEEHRVC